MLSSFPRIASFVLTIGVTACSSSPVPVGTNTGNLDNGPSSSGGGSQSSGSQGGGSQASGSQGPCASAAIPTIGCPSGPIVQTCDTSTTPPSWQITCSGESGGQAQSMPSNPCGDLPVALPSCASGEPTYICDGAGTAPRWTSACHGTIGVPIGDAGSSSPGSPGSDSGTTACDALPVDTIGCPSGEPIYTCVVDSGAPHWSIGCP